MTTEPKKVEDVKSAQEKLHYCGTRPEYCKRCRGEDSSPARKSAIDLDKLLAGAEKAGEILERRENEPEHTERCLNVDGKCIHPSKPSEPSVSDWEKEFETEFVQADYVESPARFLRAFITEVERAAEERGWSEGYREGTAPERLWVKDELAKARADTLAEVVEKIEEYFKGLSLIPFPHLTKKSLIEAIKSLTP